MGKPREPHGSCGGQCGGSCIRVFWPACRIAGKLLAASPGAFCLQTKEVSGNNRVSPPCLAFLLGAAPGSRPVPQAPQAHAQLQAAPQNYLVLRGYTVVTSSLCHFLYNKPKRDYIGKAREFSGDCGNSLGSEKLVSTIVYVSVHLPRVGGGCIQVLWPTCKVAAEYFRIHCWSPFQPEQREQVGSARYYCTHLASPPGAAPVQ